MSYASTLPKVNRPTARKEGSPIPSISVIVPTLDEEDEIEETLHRARHAVDGPCEFIVVDGGSTDRTVSIAARHARVLAAEPCRGAQLRRGAAVAQGDVLLFLHADTWLPPDAGGAVREAVSQGTEVGCFQFGVRGSTARRRMRLLELCVNWRSRLWKTATGDQALFTTKQTYAACCGFQDIPLFEDVSFVQSARRVGRFSQLDLTALTSGRRWQGHFLRTVALHLLLRVAFVVGVDPRRLHQVYSRRRRHSRCPAGSGPSTKRRRSGAMDYSPRKGIRNDPLHEPPGSG